MTYYFFKTMADKGRNRLRPLAGQMLEGTKVDQTLNVQSDKTIRTMYPIGTVFGSDTLVVCAGYYQTGLIYPLGLRDDEYKHPDHRPSEALQRAYEVYIGATSSGGEEFRDAEAETPTEGVSLLSRMQRNK